ncbi:hypothetical protein MHYP_G00142400 [Metynnis hypsauchen]
MKFLILAITTHVLLCCVNGDWWKEYEEALKHHSQEELSQEQPGKIRPQSFLHPPFQCPEMSPSPTIPTSVERVKAVDIKVIAALGDSLTTAIAANASDLLGVPFEYRHISWSIGGHGTYQDVITLANIVKLFNPNVLGPAPVRTLHNYPTTLNETGFNLAVTGHNTVSFCSCLVLPDENSTELAELVEVNLQFQRKLEDLLSSDRFFKEDFAVVLQPYLTHAKPPRLADGTIDLSFFTPDCFHFTIKGHEELAKGLWNNMEHPYIYTRPKALSSANSLQITWTLMTLTGLFTVWTSVY